MRLGWVILIVLGCVLLVLTVSLLAVCAVQRKANKRKENGLVAQRNGRDVAKQRPEAQVDWAKVAKSLRPDQKRLRQPVTPEECGLVVVAFGPQKREKLWQLRSRLEDLGSALPVTLWTTQTEPGFSEWEKKTFSAHCPWTTPTLLSKLASASLLTPCRHQLVIDLDVYFGEVDPAELFRCAHAQTNDCLLWREPHTLVEEQVRSGSHPNVDLGLMVVHKASVEKAMQLVCHSEASANPKPLSPSAMLWWGLESTGAQAHVMESQPSVARNPEADVGVLHWYERRALACHYSLAYDQVPTVAGTDQPVPGAVKRVLEPVPVTPVGGFSTPSSKPQTLSDATT